VRASPSQCSYRAHCLTIRSAPLGCSVTGYDLYAKKQPTSKL
jgi:hypothetical protein